VSFLAHARVYSDAAASGKLLGAAKSAEQMQRIIFNDYVDAGLCALFIFVVVSMVVLGVRACLQALASRSPTVHEAEVVRSNA
jgi:carbon starvation protein